MGRGSGWSLSNPSSVKSSLILLYTVYIQKKSPWKHGYIGSKVVAVHSPLTSQQKIEEQHIDHLQIYYYLKQGENY